MKAVILAAGFGTRFLPITRVVPKELLPLGTRPALDFVLDELIAAGVTDLLVITSTRKRAIEDWFARDAVLDAALPGDPRLSPPAVRVEFAYQEAMTGSGDALLLAREFAGRDAIVVAYPDDLFVGGPNCTAELLETHARTGRCVLSVTDEAGADLSRFGIVDVAHDGADLRVRRIVEKPAPGTAPSTLVSWGRYVYTPDLFDALAVGRRSHQGGEYYHVPAVNLLAERGGVAARLVRGTRYDVGTPAGYRAAFAALSTN
jgi:UTP--glucose-1-phosphate uridylyltransferase